MVDAAGRHLAFTEDGPPQASPRVVFVHGAGGTRRVWARLGDDLSRRARRVVALDLPGHGRSEGPGCARIEEYAGWVLRFLEACGARRPVLAGHSMGGGVALACALAAPGALGGLILLGTGARLRVRGAILQGIRTDFERTVDAIVDCAFAPGAPPVMAEESRRELLACPPAVAEGDLRACDAFDVLDRLGEIALPTLVLCGESDALTPPNYSRFLAERIPGARLALVEGAGHMLMIERPAPVGESIAAFLDTLS
ncbi:MAG: alpha/beta hydrolase [Candidatus Tectomicrobia bacterium]|nr:alpha/beta hydrolase [Candidatus Tectomicrobia bacterium]